MSFIFAIYTEDVYRELHLPVLNNSDYTLVLRAGEFRLEKDVLLQLEVVDEIWRFRRSGSYQLLAEGRMFEGKPLQQGQVLRLVTEAGEHLAMLVWAASAQLRAWPKFCIENTDCITIGTQPDNDICCSPIKKLISGHHAEILLRSGRAAVRDWSTNGTYLGNLRVQGESELRFGDLINLFGLSILYLGRFLAVSSLNEATQFREEHLRPLEEVTLSDNTQMMSRPAPAETMVHISPRVIPELYTEPEVIEQIPPRREQDKKPVWMTILPSITMVIPMALGFVLMGSGMGMGIVISVGSAAVGCIWACVNLSYAHRTQREQELLRLTRYEEYLVQCADRIRGKFEYNQEALQKMYPSAELCAGYRAKTPELWARRKNNADFLFARMGLGKMPFQVKISAPKAGFALVPDELAQRPERIASSYQTLEDVPLGVNLGEHNVVGLLSREGEGRTVSLARTLITQIAATHSYTDVKLATLFDGKQEHPEEWAFVRWLPHAWNEERSMRYTASDREEISDVLYALTQVLRSRSEQRNASYGGKKTRFLPHYVLFVESAELLEGQMICKYLYEDGTELGITTVILAREYEELPSACSFVIEDNYSFSGMYRAQESSAERQEVVFDRLSLAEAEKMARHLSSLRVGETESSSDIPNALTFFDMLGVRRLEELNVEEHWRKNRTYESMRALVGQKAGGADCYLDIHEKYHGPHGLVAGTTGSGKSETLQTYILSLAVNFSPQDVGFFIIDFKGGGMANLFSNLPHMLGQISNLSGNQVRRAMVSIKSENQRRQRIFGEFGVNHIDAYTRLVKNREATVPIPRLLIIIDEFAELKREEPEFMRELISVAQVGRSLGVHLILATQKPSGTVDDNIWSNTRFKLCLRVADKHDSNDMLHKPDAAYLTQAGRCYLQVGNDEIYELFQSGWSGAAYDPSGIEQKAGALLVDLLGREVQTGGRTRSEQKAKARRDWIAEIVAEARKAAKAHGLSFSGERLRQGELETLVQDIVAELNRQEERYPGSAFNLRRMEELLGLWPEKSETLSTEQLAEKLIAAAGVQGKKLPELRVKTQLEAVVDYLAETAEATGLQNHQQLWMPVLPEELYLEQLTGYQETSFRDGAWPEHGGEFRLGVLMGLVDAPENQMQFPLNLDLAQNGHLALVGGVTSGKSTFLQTLFFSLISSYSPEEVNLYGIDFSSQMLCPFAGDAHVGGIVLEGEDDRLNKLFGLLSSMLRQRKGQIRGGSFRQYIQTHGPVLPAVVLTIDGYANFREKTENRFESTLMELAQAEGYGIYMVIACGSFGGAELQSKIAEKMRQGISLEQSDRFRYNEVLHLSHIDVLPEANVKGRGLTVLDKDVLEFQTALACRAENDYKRAEEISRRCGEMSRCWTGRRAVPIPEIPKKPTWKMLSERDDYKSAIESGERLPVAYCQETAALYSVELSNLWCYLVLGREQSGKSVFLRNLACAARDVPGSKLYLIDTPDGGEELTAECTGAQHVKTPQELLQAVKTLILLTNERVGYRKELQQEGLEDEEIFEIIKKKYTPVFFFVANLREFMQAIYTSQPGIGPLNSWLENIFQKGQLSNIYFFAAANCGDLAQMAIRPAYQSFVREKHGVLLGGELNHQNHFAYQNVRFADQSKTMKPGMGYAAAQEGEQTVELIVIPQNKGRDRA